MPALSRLACATLTLSALLAVSPARAEDPVERYKMVPLESKPGTFESRVMILDTAEGYLWQWWALPSVGGGSPSSGITYLGRVGPGSASSAGAPANHTLPPLPILPRH